MKIWCINPSGASFWVNFNPENTSLRLPKQVDRLEPRTLDIAVPSGVPIQQWAQVLVYEESILRFRGFVKTYSGKRNYERTFSCEGMEALLNTRPAPDYFYPIGTKFSELFGDTCTDLSIPGLLAGANSALLPGWKYTVYDAAHNIIKIANGGRSFRLATKSLYSVDYRYLRKLDEAVILSDLDWVDNAFYRDASDLYVRLDNFYHRGWADVGGLWIENAFDTKVRLGNISDANKSLAGTLQTTVEDKTGDLIVDTAKGHGFFVHFRDTVNFTYIDLDQTEGR